MKTIDRIIIILFVLCLIFSAIVWPVIIMMTRDTYYQNQFERIDTMPPENELRAVYYIDGDSNKVAFLSKSQFEEIIKHITDFISGEKESFALTLDGVLLNGEHVDGVDIFGDVAVEHMLHVRSLYNNVKIIAIIVAVVLVCCGIYMIKRKPVLRDCVYEWSLGTMLSIVSAIILFLVFVLIKVLADGNGLTASSYLRELWFYMHHLFFPFDSAKFGGSFFNDALTDILTLEFFMNTVGTIIINLIAITSAWLISAKIIRGRKY